MSGEFALEFANVSDPGKKRPHNEDSAITDSALGLALVADGMGGYKAGEVASAIAAKVVLDRVLDGRTASNKPKASPGSQLSADTVLIRGSIEEANRYIFETAQTVPQCQGMGTTIVAALFSANRVTIAHVGDSRIYLYRNGELKQVTNDHSLVQELIDRGFYTPEEAQANTPKNLVTRALGIEDQVDVEVQELAVQAEDIYLLCSDGLNDMVNDEEIRLTLSKYSANLAQAAHELVQKANIGGGKDNISVVLARASTPRRKASGFKMLSGLRSRGS